MWYVSKDTRETWQALTILEGPTDVLIKLNATGICHSDLHFMLNDWALPKMSDLGTRCAGHEGSGVIVKVGDQVKNLKPGMRAGYKVSKPPIIS
jgi:D-arabinose 1-dehydrogenase-like Zn-dependent alcohol dehydrogenase